MNNSEPPKPIPIYVARNEIKDVTEQIVMARKKFLLFFSQITGEKADIPGYWKPPIRYTVFEKRNQKESLEGNYKEQRKFAVDGTEHMVRTTDQNFYTGEYYQHYLNFRDRWRKMFHRKNIL